MVHIYFDACGIDAAALTEEQWKALINAEDENDEVDDDFAIEFISWIQSTQLALKDVLPENKTASLILPHETMAETHAGDSCVVRQIVPAAQTTNDQLPASIEEWTDEMKHEISLLSRSFYWLASVVAVYRYDASPMLKPVIDFQDVTIV